MSTKLTNLDLLQIRWFHTVFNRCLVFFDPLPYKHELAFILAIKETCDDKVKYNLLKKNLIRKWILYYQG